ncbi:type II toxin-antitoxin system RelE/ParE family toxin [Nitrosospira multiformis]|uniref:type II toxin-antitoxin system RelE/ParE family toxin n=1 Tax=Nitrosospira multiformis TaxID=1231 RepID=UPI000943A233|nr:type II toxin-antitoxin system RelE/ParE family toxin [Nitrosospira multiformis]
MIVTLQAFNDVAQARDWYEKQRPGLGNDFISKVEEALEMIESNPLLYPALVKDARRANMKRFPYGIWFKVEEVPVVIACLHHRRNPTVIKGRTP